MPSAAKSARRDARNAPVRKTEVPRLLTASQVWQPAPVERFRVLSNYAFYCDDGLFHAWPEGAVITDPEEIALLTERSAPVERIYP